MKSTLLLLTLACAFGQTDGGEWLLAPKLTTGFELVYAGDCVEETLDAGSLTRKVYRFENHLFVLSVDPQSYDVAVMTTLSTPEPVGETRFRPVSVKIDLARINAHGRLKAAGNAGAAMTPLPFLEFGSFIEAPATRVGKNSSWEVADEGRPPRSWVVLGSEMCDGQPCAKLQGQQQSGDWDQPRADRKAWRQRDIVWMSAPLGVAVKVVRTLEFRDPARREPSQRIVTQYKLESPLRYPGKFFDDRKFEILQAKRFTDDAGLMLKQAAQYSAQLDSLQRKISYHIENSPPTPYRKAVVHLAQRIDSARKGELLLADYTTEEPVTPFGPLRIGQKAPDTLVSDLVSRKNVRLSRLLGRPTLIVYYNPQTKLGSEILTFAKGVAEKLEGKVSIMAMAVTTDADIALKQYSAMQLPFPVFDGSALRLAFAVEATPRFIVLDADGTLRASTTGWASHIGDELLEEIGRAINRPAPTP
jgi:hypothetical protein